MSHEATGDKCKNCPNKNSCDLYKDKLYAIRIMAEVESQKK